MRANRRDGRGDRVWRPAVDRLSYGPIRILGEDGELATIGEFGMRGFDMRQAGSPFVEAADRMLAQPEMSEAEGLAFARELLPGILHGFRIGEVWLDDLRLSVPDEVEAGLQHFTVAGLSADGIDRIGLDGFRIVAADAEVSLLAFELAGLAFPELEALIRAAELGNAEDDEAAQQQMAELAPSLAPRIARMLIEGVSVSAEGVGPITLDSYLVELGNYIGAVPASARSALTGLSIPRSVLDADLVGSLVAGAGVIITVSGSTGLGGGHTTFNNLSGTDIFCSSQIIMPASGSIFLAGGDNWTGAGTTNTGNNNSNTFNYTNNTLTRQNNMNRARWYSSSTTLLNGETYIQGGTGGTDRPEIRDVNGAFRLLSGANTSALDFMFPRNYIAPDGRVFGFDSAGRMYYVNTAGTGSVVSAGQFGGPTGSDSSTANFQSSLGRPA